MNDDELMFNKYKKYVAEWAERAIRGDRVISFEEWRKRKSTEVRNSFIEMVKDTRASYISYQYDITELALAMNYLDGAYKKVCLLMRIESIGFWTVSSKAYFNFYVDNYNCASWEYDSETKEVKRECRGGNDLLEFLMNPEVCRLFIGKSGIVKLP